jgi:hypothetical protein
MILAPLDGCATMHISLTTTYRELGAFSDRQASIGEARSVSSMAAAEGLDNCIADAYHERQAGSMLFVAHLYKWSANPEQMNMSARRLTQCGNIPSDLDRCRD